MSGLEGGENHGEKWLTLHRVVCALTATPSKRIKTHTPTRHFQKTGCPH